MEGNNIYFAVFLLSTLYTVCSSYCPSSQLPNKKHLPYKNCSRYYNAVEVALLKDEFNQYRLHEEFFPSSHSAPLYGYVNYTNLTDEYGYPDDIPVCVPWSSSVLLAYIDPFTLNGLQLRLMEFIFVTTGVRYLTNLDLKITADGKCDHFFIESPTEHIKYHNTIVQLTLTLNVSMPREAAWFILSDLTSWLKVYASALDVRKKWNTQDYQYKGYSATDRYYFPFGVSNLFYSIYLALIGLSILLFIYLVPEWYRKATAKMEKGNQWYSFFWALSFVATLCNTAVIACEIYVVLVVPQPFYQVGVNIVYVIPLLFVIDLIIAGMIRKDPVFPEPKTLILYCICCCCCCSETLQLKVAQTLALWNLLVFIHFVTMSVLPTLLWMFVLPVQMLAVTALLVTTLFFATTLIAFIIKNTSMLRRRNTCKESCRVFLPVVGVGLFLALVILASVFYIKLINTGVNPSNVGNFIASFIPSATLTIIGWFVTKGLFDKLFNPPEESDRNTSAANTSANDIRRAEEGLIQSESTPLLLN